MGCIDLLLARTCGIILGEAALNHGLGELMDSRQMRDGASHVVRHRWKNARAALRPSAKRRGRQTCGKHAVSTTITTAPINAPMMRNQPCALMRQDGVGTQSPLRCRLDPISLTFMLNRVPMPVIRTCSGNTSSCLLARISRHRRGCKMLKRAPRLCRGRWVVRQRVTKPLSPSSFRGYGRR